MGESVYAVIVGSGVAGSLVAQSMLAAGKGPILMLEAGPDIKMGDPGRWFKYVATGDAPYTATYDEASDFTATGIEPWNITGGRVQGRGGTTNHWGGWLPRYMEEDFKQNTNTGVGLDWPYDYSDLEPYYQQAEQYFGTEGDSSEIRPPRSTPFPFDAAPFPITADPYIDAFKAQNMTYRHVPMSRYGKSGSGFGTPCRTTGTCDYCPIGGRFTGNQPLDVISNSQFELRLGAATQEIRMSSKTTATGVSYLDTSTGQTVVVDAQVVIVAAGAFENPKLLQRSVSSFWSQGLGNDYDLVGRYLVANKFFFVNGVSPTNPEQYEQELGFPNLCSRYYDSPATQKTGKFFLTMDFSEPTIDVASLMYQGKTTAEIQAATTGATKWELFGNLSGISLAANRISNETGVTRYGLPKTLIATPSAMYSSTAMENYVGICTQLLQHMKCTSIDSGSYPQRGDHAACTTRMATDPTQGVVDKDLKVHGTDNVYVLGNSVLPSLPAANPTLTMVAMIYKSLTEFSDLLTRE
ncbi:GMC family oxidoreductase [Parasedimentitalea maritima]|uniref:GMC family oxidoreductase n=1 Tax=Parasedimentitalea maritima TaxID=2578117 RepID=A0ABY2UNK9_9RHOB|nr:GMC family oxidoreductase [Zongyanglinia marina]TLP55503.1 GMC family oxidoreductase [Zongyanglinia marina]